MTTKTLKRISTAKISKRVKKTLTRKPVTKKISKRVKKTSTRKPVTKKISKRVKITIKRPINKKNSKRVKKISTRKSVTKKVKKISKRVKKSIRKSVSKKIHKRVKKHKFGDDKWDILIHASHPRFLEKIIQDKELKTNKRQIDAWLQNDETKKYFGEYFLQNNNRYNVIKLITKNANDTQSLKDKTKNATYQPELINEEDLNWVYAPGIYTTYIWSDLDYDGRCWSFNCSPKLIFGISTDIFEDMPWVACPGNVYGDCIRDNPLKKGMYGKGNLSVKPDLEEVKDTITNRKDKRDFVDSHEVIFDKVPLKYISVIFTTKMFLDDVKRVVKDLNIPVVEIPDISRDRMDYKNILKPYASRN